MVDGQYTLAFKEGQIWKVDYAQIGDCVWNKNPNTGGNEPSIYIIPNSPSFKWTSKWEGGECKELFTAFYKVFR